MAMVSFGRGERRLPSSVVSTFQSGLQSIDNLMTALQDGHYNFKKHVEKAHVAFSEAEDKLDNHIRRQTRKCREQEAELSSMQRRNKAVIKSLTGLEDSLEYLSIRLKKQKKKAEGAQEEVDDSEKRVKKAQSEYDEVSETRNKVQTVVKYTWWIPVVGTSVALYDHAILKPRVDNAEGCLDSAESDLTSAEHALREMTEQHENTRAVIKRHKKTRTRLEDEMEEIEEDIYAYRKDINKQNRTLTALRKVMTRLGKVSGRAEVLRDATAIMHEIAEIGIPLKSLFDSFEDIITQPDLWKKVLSRPEFLAVCDDDDDDW
ncbi:tropomyosin-2-like [Haliotis cracherodii]|uniref:tropomyosin-2-like n=1 Tax=Haliotis cracherodii TaxID=6455 RepID=UPI0039E98337